MTHHHAALQQGLPPLTVLAHCSVGRVLVRKLLLRGYAVTAMVRSLEDTNLPQSVKLVQGDVTDYQSCRRALDGIDKVCPSAPLARASCES